MSANWEANMIKIQDWSSRELLDAAKLLIAYARSVDLSSPYIGRNNNSGNIYLADEDGGDSYLLTTAGEAAELPTIETELWLNTPYEGREGTISDLADDFFDLHSEDQQYLLEHPNFDEPQYREIFMSASVEELETHWDTLLEGFASYAETVDTKPYLDKLLNLWPLFTLEPEGWSIKDRIYQLIGDYPDYRVLFDSLLDEVDKHDNAD